MTPESVRQIAQQDPTATLVERWGTTVIATRKAVALLEDRLRELDKVTDQLAERQLVVATDLGATGNSARSAYQASVTDNNTAGYRLPTAIGA